MNAEYFRTLGKSITEEQVGERLDAFLAKHFPFLSRAGWQKRLDEDMILINGLGVRAAYKLKLQDQIAYYHPPSIEPAIAQDLELRWRDKHIMAVEKPAHIPMHENGAFFNNTFTKLLQRLHGKAWYPIHRLDKETSGLVLCADQSQLRAILADNLKHGRIKKQYLALVHGVPDWQTQLCEAPIGDLVESRIRIKKWVSASGLSAKTRFTVLKSSGAPGSQGRSLILAEPLTGRTNQIRIHLAYLGHHIVGDKLYHPDEKVFLLYAEENQSELAGQLAGHSRLCLHAHRLTFQDPLSGTWCLVESPMPDDFANLLDY